MTDTQRMHPIKVVLRKQWPPLSQAKLAQRLEMNPNVLTMYLSGRRQPPEGFYLAAAKVLGCEPDELRPADEVAA